MNSKTRAQLRSYATSQETIAQMGKEGITDSFKIGIEQALDARELVKISVLHASDRDLKALADELAQKTDSEVVTVIGSKIVLYRKSDKNGVTHILGRQMPKDPRIKPNSSGKTNYAGEHNTFVGRAFGNRTQSGGNERSKSTSGRKSK